MTPIDFSKYTNNLPYANYKTDRAAFDAWANRNDYLVQEFTNDVVQYMNDYVVENKLDNKLKINSLRKIVELAINENNTPEEQFDLCIEIIEVLK